MGNLKIYEVRYWDNSICASRSHDFFIDLKDAQNCADDLASNSFGISRIAVRTVEVKLSYDKKKAEHNGN